MRISLLDDSPHGKTRSIDGGYTLLEILVVMTIIALLAGIILPAVQAIRESARRSQCAHNLHQIGLALHQYEASNGVFPPGTSAGYSFLAAILPCLDRTPIYNALNFSAPPFIEGEMANQTVTRASVEVFLCPSDAVPTVPWGWTNYAGNRGSETSSFPYDGAFSYPPQSPFGSQQFTDGLSQTVGVAEWVLGGGPGAAKSRGAIFEISASTRFPRACRTFDVRIAAAWLNIKGSNWKYGDYPHSLYNHILSVKARSCTNMGSIQDGIFTAGSWHKGGANTLTMDGSVHYVKATIHPRLWRALGTAHGAEIVPTDILY